jgi:hypothetical protein
MKTRQIERQQAQLEAVKRENKKLKESLTEAMEWNWLDDDEESRDKSGLTALAWEFERLAAIGEGDESSKN